MIFGYRPLKTDEEGEEFHVRTKPNTPAAQVVTRDNLNSSSVTVARSDAKEVATLAQLRSMPGTPEYWH